MNYDDSESVRWRGSILAVTIFIVLALVGEALIPGLAEAKPKPRPGPGPVYSESRLDPHKAEAPQRRRGGVHGQIVGGRVVPQGKFTFMTFVQVEVEPGSFFQCGGSLIDPLFVLTAAHCVVDDANVLFDPSAFVLAIGKADLNEIEDANLRGVAEVTRHPAFDPVTFENDVAVLQLDEPVFGSIAQLLPMVGSDETRFDGAGQAAVVAGWGTTSEGGNTSDLLLEADLSIVSDAACGDAYGPGFVESVMICAAFAGRDSCQGDSGGPLLAKEVTGFKVKKGKKKKHKKRKKKKTPIFEVTQMGIVSFGEGCAQPAFPGVYTRLSAPGINDFIVETMNN